MGTFQPPSLINITGNLPSYGYASGDELSVPYTTRSVVEIKRTFKYITHQPRACFKKCLYCCLLLVHIAFLPEPAYKGPDYVTYFRGPNFEVI